jgi:excisionase family DNA binding protein
MGDNISDSDSWLSLDDIATYLGVSKDTVRNWIKKNNMPAYKVGHLWKFRKAEVDNWISSGLSKM